MTTLRRLLLTILSVCLPAVAGAHQGPDPLMHWVFNNRTVTKGECRARLGPDLKLPPEATVANDSLGSSLDLKSDSAGAIASGILPPDSSLLPREAFTVSAWLTIDEAEPAGGVAGVWTEAQPSEAACLLGYNGDSFTLAVRGATGEASLVGNARYQKGTWTHVVGVYDGDRLQLYVNGKLDAECDAKLGEVAYTQPSRIAIAGMMKEGAPPLRGKLREVSFYNLAARAAWVDHAFTHLAKLTRVQPDVRQDDLSLIVEPYLQYGTQTGMTVMWQTSLPASSVVHYGETADCDQSVEADKAEIHELRIEELEPETQYFYRVESKTGDGQSVSSDVSTFSTAVRPGTPFAFAVISDTQFNPVVSGKLSKLAWAQRPSFLLHPGDLVDTGVNDSHWTQHFFPGMHELISRVPMYPVLGNHEQNASNYYEYMSLPDPEYYYDFQFGDAHFFMVDSNRNVGPESEQYQWLDNNLAESDAKWKFACHHHPLYSSDENDYGDLWKTNKSNRGDLRVRPLSKLYEKHAIDIVWNGHIHSYERTWPVKEDQAVNDDAPIYMIVGGGGGNLETPGPYRPFFQNQVRRRHHYVMVHINGNTLELRSYDLDDRLFDTVRLEK